MRAPIESLGWDFTASPDLYISEMEGQPFRRDGVIQNETNKRSLHLIDIENLLGDPFCSDPCRIQETFDTYWCLADWRPGDQVLIAANAA